jgi:hypothetical protein
MQKRVLTACLLLLAVTLFATPPTNAQDTLTPVTLHPPHTMAQSPAIRQDPPIALPNKKTFKAPKNNQPSLKKAKWLNINVEPLATTAPSNASRLNESPWLP